jgi:hypothetical protein
MHVFHYDERGGRVPPGTDPGEGCVLEKRGLPYAVLDLDFLAWFHTREGKDHPDLRMLLANLIAVLNNYRAAGVRFFVMAGSIRGREQLDRTSSWRTNGRSDRWRSKS